MPTTLTQTAIEQSTFIVTASFKDETGAACVPNALTWTLTDTRGKIINNRREVSITPGTSVNIVLQGADLAVSSVYQGAGRIVLIEGTYDSDLGTDLPIKDEVRFTIEDLTGL